MASELGALSFLFQLLHIRLPTMAFSSTGGLVAALTLILSAINTSYDFATRFNPHGDKSESYDFIIVGGGTAGCVLANRLAKGNRKLKVLLLEAGGDPLSINEIPYLAAFNLHRSDTEWMYKTIPQANSSFAHKDNSMNWPVGKSLGGSSNLGLMIHSRGSPNDFDNWAKLTGDPQWSYANVLKFFKKSEKYEGHFPSSKYHGTDGLLKINRIDYQPLVNEWVGAGQELGYPSVDPNANQVTSFVPVEYTIHKGYRRGVYQAFLLPVIKKRNLKVVRYAKVTKIHVDDGFKATGVTYKRHAKKMTVRARKEIILCAGAVGSPHLLMLSGIGPIEQLTTAGIVPVVHLPGVGRNLQDHVGTLIGPFFLNDGTQKSSMRADRNITPSAALEFTNSGTGPLSFSYVSGMGFVNTSGHTSDWPNIALYQMPLGIHKHFHDDLHHLYGLDKEYLKPYFKDYEKKDAVFVMMSLGLPKTRGSIVLAGNDLSTKPFIQPNYYGELADVYAMVEGFRLVVKLFEETKVWHKYGATFTSSAFPGCELFKLKSNVYYECYLRHFTISLRNPSSTCKMGRLEDHMTVVDSNLRVKYIKGLRVADASIMPQITNSDLGAPTVMIAEKAAQMILQTWAENNTNTD